MNLSEYKIIFATSYADDAHPIVELLNARGIPAKVTEEGASPNPYMGHMRPPDAVKLYVLLEDYEDARAILVEEGVLEDLTEEQGLEQMMEEMEDEELLEIVADHQRQPTGQPEMARKILEARGVKITDSMIEEEIDQIVIEERKTRRLSVSARVILILVALLAPAVGSFACIVIAFFSTRDARGQNYFLWEDRDRYFAMMLGGMGLVISLLVIIFYRQLTVSPVSFLF